MMIRKRYGLHLVMLIAVFAAAFLFVLARPADAQGNSWVRWLIDYKFIGSTQDIKMTMTVQYGSIQGSQYVIEDEYAEDASCITYGSPQFVGGRVIFDGSSYFECDLPSPQQMALEKWGFNIPPICEVANKPFAIANATLDTTPIQSSPLNPIFYRDDLQFGAPLDLATGQADLVVQFGQESSRSDAFTPGNRQQLVGVFNKTGANQYAPSFFAGGSSLNATPATVNGPITMSNLASTAYLGYSPASGNYFEGSLGPGRFDPVCTGGG